jgi:hypothetical protein
VSSVDQTVIDLVEDVCIWGVPGLEVDSFVAKERTFDRHLPACGKVNQSEAIFICTLHAVLAYPWLIRFLGQLLHLCLSSLISRHDLGSLRMPAVLKIDHWSWVC